MKYSVHLNGIAARLSPIQRVATSLARCAHCSYLCGTVIGHSPIISSEYNLIIWKKRNIWWYNLCLWSVTHSIFPHLVSQTKNKNKQQIDKNHIELYSKIMKLRMEKKPATIYGKKSEKSKWPAKERRSVGGRVVGGPLAQWNVLFN